MSGILRKINNFLSLFNWLIYNYEYIITLILHIIGNFLVIYEWVLINFWNLVTVIIHRINSFLIIYKFGLIKSWGDITGIIRSIIPFSNIWNWCLYLLYTFTANHRWHHCIWFLLSNIICYNNKFNILQVSNFPTNSPYQILFFKGVDIV